MNNSFQKELVIFSAIIFLVVFFSVFLFNVNLTGNVSSSLPYQDPVSDSQACLTECMNCSSNMLCARNQTLCENQCNDSPLL